MKKLLPVVLLTALLLMAVLTAKYLTANEKAEAVLSGEVSWTIAEGEAVTEGTELIRIRTLTGEIAAARSPVNGTVARMLVKPKDVVKRGDAVAELVK